MKVTVTIKLDESVVKNIDKTAKEEKRNRSTQIEYILENQMKGDRDA